MFKMFNNKINYPYCGKTPCGEVSAGLATINTILFSPVLY